MDKTKKMGFEMKLILAIFFIMCGFILVGPILGDACVEQYTYCYALLSIIGVVLCIKRGLFMVIDSFVLMYPKRLQCFLKKFCDVVTLAFFLVLTAAGIIAFRNFGVGSDLTTHPGKVYALLYATPIIVYPWACYSILKDLLQTKKGIKMTLPQKAPERREIEMLLIGLVFAVFFLAMLILGIPVFTSMGIASAVPLLVGSNAVTFAEFSEWFISAALNSTGVPIVLFMIAGKSCPTES